jgi:hypothetical protein
MNEQTKETKAVHYYAAVKYAVDADPKDKIRALREGLEFVACELVDEHGVSLEEVEDWLNDAAQEARYAVEEKERRS